MSELGQIEGVTASIGTPSLAPLCVGALVFLGLGLLLALDEPIPCRKNRRISSKPFVPPCRKCAAMLASVNGSSTQIFQAKKGLKNPGPCEDPLTSAPRGGL